MAGVEAEIVCLACVAEPSSLGLVAGTLVRGECRLTAASSPASPKDTREPRALLTYHGDVAGVLHCAPRQHWAAVYSMFFSRLLFFSPPAILWLEG